MDVWKLAYEYAMKFIIKVPDVWRDNNTCAGPDRLSSFLKRNTDLSVRKPEAATLLTCTFLKEQCETDGEKRKLHKTVDKGGKRRADTCLENFIFEEFLC
jgi:hypothetical protein